MLPSSYLTRAATVLPQITFVGVDHSPLVAGDKEAFYITSKNADLVQYRIFLYTETTDKWEELTEGYTAAVEANSPYTIASDRVFGLGKYRLSIWVKKANTNGTYKNSNGGYDSYYTAYLNCVNRDNANRVYANDDMDIIKDNYAVGEKVTINGIKNISGMKGPYKYKLHLYNASKDIWIKDVTAYNNSIGWTPSEAGNYVIDLWATSSDSKAKYESWKLKTITVGSSINKYGNLSGNIESNGLYATQGQWVYYFIPSDGLFKMKLDGSSKINLFYGHGININVVGNWIYYTGNDGFNYKVRIDGTYKMKASDIVPSNIPPVSDPTVVQTADMGNTNGNIISGGIAALKDGWFYFLNDKMKLDGSQRSTVIKDSLYPKPYLNVVGNYIYYKRFDKSSTDYGPLYRTNINSTQGGTLITNNNAFDINVTGDWVYYTMYDSGWNYYVCKVKTDGTGNTFILHNVHTLSMNVTNGWIYYINASDGFKIYKVKTDGTSITKISDNTANRICVVEDWIYYTNKDDSSRLYKINIDGNDNSKLSDFETSFINVSNGYVYSIGSTKELIGSTLTYTSGVFKIRTDGFGETKLAALYNPITTDTFTVIGDWIYYKAMVQDGFYTNNYIMRVKTDGSVNEKFQRSLQ